MTDSAQWAYNRPHYFTAVVATDGANATKVTITVRTATGAPVVTPKMFDLWLSDNASTFNVTATTASGAVQGKTDGTTGKDIVTYISKKALKVQTVAAGTYVLSITDTAKTAFKVCGEIDGVPYLIATLATASYG